MVGDGMGLQAQSLQMIFLVFTTMKNSAAVLINCVLSIPLFSVSLLYFGINGFYILFIKVLE
jgi:hypothetical protein